MNLKEMQKLKKTKNSYHSWPFPLKPLPPLGLRLAGALTGAEQYVLPFFV